jgi:hypothetical protein
MGFFANIIVSLCNFTVEDVGGEKVDGSWSVNN